jgi:transposase-like protein
MVSEATASDVGADMRVDTSRRVQGIEVITRSERRCRCSAEEKQSIVEESLMPHVSVMAVAHKHGIGIGRLYQWRHQLLGTGRVKAAGFARVEVADEPYRLSGPVAATSSARCGLTEIELPSGPTIRVDAQVDEHVLRRVLGLLRG